MNLTNTNSTNNLLTKLLAVVLVVVMVVCMMPADVNAATASSKTEDIAFFGVDKDHGDCDTIYIVHINHSSKTAKIMSIYRDCMVKVKGYSGYNKIKWAHQYGGPELAMDTINRNFDLNVTKYVSANFEGFTQFIDDLGGVDITVTETEAKVLDQWGTGISTAGKHKMTGAQALIYCRIRHDSGGDYARTDRNRNMFKTIYAKAAKMSLTEKVSLATKTLENVDKNVNTNLSASKLKSLLDKISTYKIESDTAYPDVFYTGEYKELWVEVPYNLKDMSTSIHNYLFPDETYTTSKNINTYSSGLITLANKQVKNRSLVDRSGIKTTMTAYNAYKVSWPKVANAVSYKVYSKKFSSSKWALKGTTTKLNYTVKSLTGGADYSFKVIPTIKKSGKKYTGPVKVCKPVTTLKKVSLTSVKKASSGKVKVTWKNINNETGYQISKATGKTKTTIVATVKSSTAKSKVIKAKKGKKYYYKVRAYKTVNGSKKYAPWSKVIAYKL